MAERSPATARTSEARRVATPSDVRLIPTGLIALAITGFFYAGVVKPLEGSYFAELFAGRGWVPPVIALLSSWSLVMLGGKFLALRRQTRALELDLLPDDVAPRINSENAAAFAERIRVAGRDWPGSFLVDRVSRSLEHFRARGEIRDAVDQLSAQADVDAAAIDASYTMINVFVWAIPILGFIGTVMGIGAAVGAFSDTVGAAPSLDVMKNSIGLVTSGLGVAFDTTLLALVMSILIKLPASSLQKTEEGFLAEVEEYCTTQLVGRFETGTVARQGLDEAVIERAVAREMAKHHAALRTWTDRLSQVGGTIRDDVVAGWQEIDERLLGREEAQRRELDGWVTEKQREMARHALDLQRELMTEFKGSLDGAARSLGELQRVSAQHLDGQLASLDRFGDSIRELQEQEAVAQRDASRSVAEGAERLVETLDHVRRQADGFQVQTSEHLGELVVQVEQFSRAVRDTHREEAETQRRSAKAAAEAARHLGETLEHVRGQLDRGQSHSAQYAAELAAQVKAFNAQVRDLQRGEARAHQAQAESVAHSSELLARTLDHVRTSADAAEGSIEQNLAAVGPQLRRQLEGIGDQMIEPWRDQLEALERLHAELAQTMAHRTQSFEALFTRLDERLAQLGRTIEQAGRAAPPEDAERRPRRGLLRRGRKG